MARAIEETRVDKTRMRDDSNAIKQTFHRAGLASIGGIAAGIAAASCCVVPFSLFTVGISGAWISNLTALEPYQPIFAAIALSFLGYGFYHVYRKPKAACAPDSYCAKPNSGRAAKIGLWTAVVLIVVALGFPKLAPLFL
jgi:mercuric ion transport protein